jgi:GntR family transcriptional repressor for pyruvate dehydrogenase complex
LIEARDVVEVRAAELAAERATEAKLADLMATIQAMEQNMNVPARYITADVDFHMAIAEMARNNVFSFILSSIRNLLAQDLNRLIGDREVRQEFIAHHRAIAAAIAGRDPQHAGQAMRSHLQDIARRLLAMSRRD